MASLAIKITRSDWFPLTAWLDQYEPTWKLGGLYPISSRHNNDGVVRQWIARGSHNDSLSYSITIKLYDPAVITLCRLTWNVIEIK